MKRYHLEVRGLLVLFNDEYDPEDVAQSVQDVVGSSGFVVDSVQLLAEDEV